VKCRAGADLPAAMPDEICIFMRTFIGPIGSVAPTRRVPYSRLACVWKFPQFTVCCKALALQTGGYCHGTAEIQDRRNNRPVEKKVAAEDQLKRIDIRAPQDGVARDTTPSGLPSRIVRSSVSQVSSSSPECRLRLSFKPPPER
jgi:hypothetical protein